MRAVGAFAMFCILLSAATLIPALTKFPVTAFVSGFFGGTFLSVVASTTAFVR